MIKITGVNSKMLRSNNKASILRRLFMDGAMSRIALSKRLGLTGAAITVLVKELLEEGILIESGMKLQRNASGRKEVLIDINYELLVAYGINIERDYVHFALCTPKKILFEETRSTDELINALNKEEYLFSVLSKIPLEKATPLGVGIGVSGFLDNSGILVDTDGLFDKNYDITQKLGALINLEVFALNNVRAQARAIIDAKFNDFLYIKHGPGLGAAIIYGGNILKGADNRAGEIGHTIVYPEKQSDAVTLEEYLAEKQLLKDYFKITGKAYRISELYSYYEVDDSVTEFLNERLNALKSNIINAVALLNPETVIVSGGLFDNDKIFAVLKNQLVTDCKIKLTRLANNVKIKSVAGARLVFDKLLFHLT